MRVTDIYMAFLSFNYFVCSLKKSSVLVVCCAPAFGFVKCAELIICGAFFSTALYA